MPNLYKHPQLSQRMPQRILDDIEKYAENREITRTTAINNAVEHYSHSKECLLCGSINNGDGKVCSVCYSELFTDEEIKNTIIYMTLISLSDEFSTLRKGYPDDIKDLDKNQIIEYVKSKKFDEYKKVVGLTPVLEPRITGVGKDTKYFAVIHFLTEDGIVLTISGIDEPTIFFNPEQVYMFAVEKYGILPKGIKKAFCVKK